MIRKLALGKMMVVLACALYTPSAKAQLTPLEQQTLAQRFRPYFKTSLDTDQTFGDDEPERMHPCNWQWFVGHCNLIRNGEIVLTDKQLAEKPEKLIEPSGADIRKSPSTSPGYILTLSNLAYLSGEPWDLVIHQGHGIYAHVEEINANLVNIEYSVLWPFNQTTVFGNHHGDLTTMTVIYDRGCDKLVRVTYVTHGKVIQTFRITHPSEIQFGLLVGQDVNGNPTAISAAQLEIPDADERQDGPEYHSPCNPAIVYLAKDPVSSRYEHPVVYVEWGAHEFWPAPCGSVTTAPNHNGDGLSFLPDVVQVLGTLDAPESVHLPFIYYNGKLGDDPQALLLHRTWYWREGRDHNRYGIPENRFTDRSPYEPHGQVAWPPTHDCSGGSQFVYVDGRNTGLINGTSQHPFRTVAQALAFVPLGGSIVIAPGSYPENLVISRPSKLISSGDIVTIGEPR